MFAARGSIQQAFCFAAVGPFGQRRQRGPGMESFDSSGPTRLEMDGRQVQYDYAVGTANYPYDGGSLAELIQAADAAMYLDKPPTTYPLDFSGIFPEPAPL